MTKTALQLYTLRNVDQPLPEIIRGVGSMGFDGVEFAGRVRETDPEQVVEALEVAGVEPVAAHVDLRDLTGDLDSILTRYETLGCHRLIIPHIGARRYFTQRRVSELATELSQLSTKLDERDFELGIHNPREMLLPTIDRFGLQHIIERDSLPTGAWNHLAWLAGNLRRPSSNTFYTRTALGRLAAELGPENLFFEIDIKGVASADYPLPIILDALAGRYPLVHLADVTRSRWIPPAYRPVDLGEGIVDVPGAVDAVLDREVEWLVVEHDDPADPITTLERLRNFTDIGAAPASTTSQLLSP